MLRARLLIHLAPFLVILAAIGICAVALFSRLTGKVDRTLTRHHDGLVAIQAMHDALSEMDKQVLLLHVGQTRDVIPAFEAAQGIFTENLRLRLQSSVNAVPPGLVRQVESAYLAFVEKARGVLAAEGLSQRIQEYEQELVPARDEVKDRLEQCRRIHQEAILDTGLEIQATGERMKFWMILGLLVALALAGGACLHFGRSILEPIRALTRGTRELAEERFDQNIPVTSRDELGQLAGAFNRMAAQLQTYRRNTSEEILRLNRVMEATLASFPDPIFVFDPEGRIELKNPAAETLLSKLHPSGHLPQALQSLVTDARTVGKSILPQEFKAALVVEMDREDRHFLPRVVVMRRSSERSVLGVALVLYDITRFRLMDDVKTNLLATVSHELKTPLTSVRVILHMLLEKTLGPLKPRQEELLRTACEDSERLLRILNNLLDLARLEQGHTELQKEWVNPDELIRTAIEAMKEQATSRTLRLHWQPDPRLPRIHVDRQRIGHVFSNLIGNAIKHAPPGTGIRIVAGCVNGGAVRFSVIDQGPGVPEEYQHRIFDRFFRVPGQENRGAGLGLSIAREIVLGHGGRIGVRTASPGSEFFFTLLLDPSRPPAVD